MRPAPARPAPAASAPRPAPGAGPLDAAAARALLDAVVDPEIPALTIAEIGILRDVRVEGGAVTVAITPTYSGCPAMAAIDMAIRDTLLAAGFAEVRVETVLSPAWTTDWLGEGAREKLRALGIAPPEGRAAGRGALLGLDPEVACPRCGARETRVLSRFGSTACKALYVCDGCGEPFDYFKCI